MEQQISIEQAKTYIANLAAAPAEGVPASETFNGTLVNAILAQPGCSGLRVSYGRKENGDICAILTAVDVDGVDLVDLIGEDGFRCPPICAPASPLTA